MTKYAWRQSIRVVVILQLGLIAFFIAWGRGWVPEPDSTAPSGSWIRQAWRAFEISLGVASYTFPIWGLVPIWKSDLPDWKLLLFSALELVLWATLWLAMLPLIQ